MLYILWGLAATLVALWLVGVHGPFETHRAIHLLLVGAVAAVLVSLFLRPRARSV
jgi:hypothetical protein